MAFSWNPAADRQQPSAQQNDSPLTDRNPNYNTFNRVNDDIARAVSLKSVIGKNVAQQRPLANPIWQTIFGTDLLAMPVATNKTERIAQYRKISEFTECQWCLDEICDDFLHEDPSTGKILTLKLPDGKENLNETRRQIIQEEFERFIGLFKLREEGYTIIRRFLVEGELAWENIINNKYEDKGIIGVKFLRPEYYETLIDTVTGERIGIFFDTEKLATDMRQILSNSYLGSAQIFNSIVPTTVSFSFNRDTCIPLLYSQITHIDSGFYSPDGLICYPILEQTKQAYHQLALLQDAAVILRVTRAPERLLFNISTGKMNQNYADEYVRNFAMGLKQKKVVTPGGDIAGVYNPVSMLESYIFGKSDGNDGTSIESVGSSADYDQLGDIEYFLRRFMKQLKVPFSRYKTPENTMEKNDTISQEEYAFSRFVIRLQRRVALGFKNGFIVDLKLRGMWDKYQLKDSDLDIQFSKPALYDLYETQQQIETRMNIYKSVVDQEEFSKIVAMKKFLGYSDADVEENFRCLIEEKQRTQLAEWYGEQLNSEGPAVFDSPVAIKGKTNTGEEEAKPEGEGGEGDSGEGKEGEGAEGEEGGEGEEEEEKKNEPPPPATFGLG